MKSSSWNGYRRLIKICGIKTERVEFLAFVCSGILPCYKLCNIMKFEAEVSYAHREHAFKVAFDKIKDPYDIIQLDDRGEKITPDAMPDTIEGNISRSLNLSESGNGLSAYHLSGNLGHNSNCKNGTSEISLIAQDLFYIGKTGTDAKLPCLSVCANVSSNIKDLCIDESSQMIEKILLDYDKVDQAIFSSLNLPRANGISAIMEETRRNKKFVDFEHSPTNKELCPLDKLLPSEIGEETAKNSLGYFLVTEYNVKQFYSGSSLEAAEQPCSEDIIDRRFNAEVSQTDLFCQNDGNVEDQSLRPKLDQAEEENASTNSFIPAEAKDAQKIVKIVPSNDDICEEEKTTVSFATFNDTESVRIDHINGTSDDFKGTDMASTSSLKVGVTFKVGNENKVIENEQSKLPQNGAEAEDPISEGTTSTPRSFLCSFHEELNMLEPFLSGSVATGLIPYSGSLSLRSESSATSAQSFAFPILQSEWSSSPIRMAKADRRQLRKQRWMAALTCCKF